MGRVIEATGQVGDIFTLSVGEASPVEKWGTRPRFEAREVIVRPGLVCAPLLLTFQQASGASDRTR
jgi:hypothetical protein